MVQQRRFSAELHAGSSADGPMAAAAHSPIIYTLIEAVSLPPRNTNDFWWGTPADLQHECGEQLRRQSTFLT